MDSDNSTNDDDDHYKGKYDSGHIIRAWAETTSEFADTNGMSAPQVERTITLWALAENNLRPEKNAEITGEYAAHSDLRPTLIIESSDGTTIIHPGGERRTPKQNKRKTCTGKTLAHVS